MVMMMTRKKPQKRRGEIHRVISEKVTGIHQDAFDKAKIEIPDYTTPDEIEKFVNNEEDDKKEITAENEDEGVIHRVITEYGKEINWDNLDMVIE